jgi:hypothetical protein
MDLAPLRALALEVNFSVFGVDATVTLAGADPIATTGVWAQPSTADMPVGGEFQRREPRRVLVFRVADVGTLPRGTTILAPEYGSAVERTWRVDGIDGQTAEVIRALVVMAPEAA